MAIATAISLPATTYSGDYFAIYSGDTIRVFQGCPYRGSTYGQQMDYTSYNAIYGYPISEGVQTISNSTYTLDSLSCSSRDSSYHGQIAITSNSLDVTAYIPYKPFYYTLSIVCFIWTMSYIMHLFFGRRMNT